MAAPRRRAVGGADAMADSRITTWRGSSVRNDGRGAVDAVQTGERRQAPARRPARSAGTARSPAGRSRNVTTGGLGRERAERASRRRARRPWSWTWRSSQVVQQRRARRRGRWRRARPDRRSRRGSSRRSPRPGRRLRPSTRGVTTGSRVAVICSSRVRDALLVDADPALRARRPREGAVEGVDADADAALSPARTATISASSLGRTGWSRRCPARAPGRRARCPPSALARCRRCTGVALPW